MNFRWYRSIIFWFGLGGLGLLVAAWLACPFVIIGAGMDLGGRSFSFTKCPATLLLRHVNYNAPGLDAVRPAENRFRIWHHELEMDSPGSLLAPPLGIVRGWSGSGARIEIAIWLVAAAYTAIWLAWLIHLQRRKRRLTKAAASA